MKEILIKHEYEGHIVNRFRFKAKSGIYTLGSSRNCDIRMMGEGIDGIHACFEFRNGSWLLIDLGSESGSWVENEPLIEQEIQKDLAVQIGEHRLSVELAEVPSDNLFKNPKKVDITGDEVAVYQQVVYLVGGKVVDSFLHDPKQQVEVPFNKSKVKLPLAKSAQWQENNFGFLKVKNRLVRSSRFVSKDQTFWSFVPKDMIKPMGYSLGLTLFFFLSLYIIPMALQSDPGGLKENQYTKLMFDQKTIEKQKKKAKKLAKQIKKKEKPKKAAAKQKKAVAKAGGPKVKAPSKKIGRVAPSRSNRKVRAKVSQVASSIKAAGLSSLVSKVSKRAASSALLVKSSGVKAGKAGSGRGFASISDMKKGAKLGSAAKSGSFRIGGVSTKGTAGGNTISGRLGGLSGTGIGSASVGALEGESEVEGGLSAEEIARVIKKNIGSIRYCYEKQLVANPNLYGKIKVEFIISPTGRVTTQKIKSSTMKNRMVEGCILRKVKRWAFPTPRGGTEVSVSYPFYFKSTK